eukprot:gene8071-biopygen1557
MLRNAPKYTASRSACGAISFQYAALRGPITLQYTASHSAYGAISFQYAAPRGHIPFQYTAPPLLVRPKGVTSLSAYGTAHPDRGAAGMRCGRNRGGEMALWELQISFFVDTHVYHRWDPSGASACDEICAAGRTKNTIFCGHHVEPTRGGFNGGNPSKPSVEGDRTPMDAIKLICPLFLRFTQPCDGTYVAGRTGSTFFFRTHLSTSQM